MSFLSEQLISSDKIPLSSSQHKISDILKNDSEHNKNQPWTKLNKTEKIEKLNAYSKILSQEKNMNDDEIIFLQNYLQVALERKRLVSVKDVIYDKDNGLIKSIPCLVFNETTNKYTLKRSEKRTSTLKSLGKGRLHKRKATNIKDNL